MRELINEKLPSIFAHLKYTIQFLSVIMLALSGWVNCCRRCCDWRNCVGEITKHRILQRFVRQFEKSIIDLQ